MVFIKKNCIGGSTTWTFEEDNLEIEFNLIPKDKKLESSIFVNGYGPFKHTVNDYVTSFNVGNDEYKIVLPNITKGQNHRHLYRNNIDVMNGQKFTFKKRNHKTKWTAVYISCLFGVGLAYYIYKSKKINKCKNAKFKVSKDKEHSESRNDVSYHKNLFNRGIELKKQISNNEIINNSNSKPAEESQPVKLKENEIIDNSNNNESNNKISIEVSNDTLEKETIIANKKDNITINNSEEIIISDVSNTDSNINSNNNSNINKNDNNNASTSNEGTTIVINNDDLNKLTENEDTVNAFSNVENIQDDAKIKNEPLNEAKLGTMGEEAKDSIINDSLPNKEEESKESKITSASIIDSPAAPQENEESALNTSGLHHDTNNRIEISSNLNDAEISNISN